MGYWRSISFAEFAASRVRLSLVSAAYEICFSKTPATQMQKVAALLS